MSTHKRSPNRLGIGLGLVLCSMGGIAAADDAIVSSAQVVAYCEGRTAHLPPEDRELAAASCRIIANGAADSLARKDLAGAVEQIRALDERLRPRIVPPEPVRCPPPPQSSACPTPPDPVACVPQHPVRRVSASNASDASLLAPRPPRPVAAPPKRGRASAGEQRNRPPATKKNPHRARDLMDPFGVARHDDNINAF